ncbi:DUF1592 domain-containing protein [Pirellulaceae bacterium SH467]
MKLFDFDSSAAGICISRIAVAACFALAGPSIQAQSPAVEPTVVEPTAVDSEAVDSTVLPASAPEDRVEFAAHIRPLLERYCWDCHNDDNSEGNVSFEGISKETDHASHADIWWNALKNVRAGIMPPSGSERLSAADKQRLATWVKTEAFGIDLKNPDPGRGVIRRLNRAEYGNTVQDLMGISFDATLFFPPDDSGHGFDNVGDALSFSPMLMEKYLKAARMVVDQAVPTVSKIVPKQEFTGRDFLKNGEAMKGNSLDGKVPAKVARSLQIAEAGEYRISIGVKLHGSFDFDPARYRVWVRWNDQLKSEEEYGWNENKLLVSEYREQLEAGEHRIEFELQPVAPKSDEDEKSAPGMSTNVRFEIAHVRIEGPTGTNKLVAPPNYERFFSRSEPPDAPEQRKEYALELLERFASRAFRGPVERSTVERLVAISEGKWRLPGATFEAGIGEAMVSVLASPRFLFRIDPPLESDENRSYGPTDERTLAARLSYFLWSTMPDDELNGLAEKGALRANLGTQVDRMLRDPKASQFVSNFVGQWLRTRDVTQIAIDPLVVLGHQEEYERLRDAFRGRFRRRPGEPVDPSEQKDRARFQELREVAERFNADLKRAMRRETEMLVEYIVEEDKSLLDLFDCNYTFLNERLADHYGIPGVRGDEMRRVELPPDSPRGGVMTHASMLLVTSNPTRTSPVKRGLFVLDNLLGTPAPPAPAAVPELEDSGSRFEGREPSLRELLSVHRESALCASCHARMDPLGLALENFNALGMWRTEEKGVAIDPTGSLITGESFSDIRELKRVLRQNHASDLYRCITQKLMTFALGRGIEPSDEHSVDLIVEALERNDGKFRVLLDGVIQSSPFQNQRTIPRQP